MIKHPSGLGSWIVILGCPLVHRHEPIITAGRDVPGPSFAVCASCEHQLGRDFDMRDPYMDWSTQAYPELLACGLCVE